MLSVISLYIWGVGTASVNTDRWKQTNSGRKKRRILYFEDEKSSDTDVSIQSSACFCSRWNFSSGFKEEERVGKDEERYRGEVLAQLSLRSVRQFTVCMCKVTGESGAGAQHVFC